MKRFKEIGVTVLKDFKVKENSEEMKKLLYEINDILYKKQQQYALYTTANRLRNILIQYGVQIKGLELKKDSFKQKQNEILQKLRTICTNLNTYILDYQETDESEINASHSLQKYQLGKYIKNKDKLTTEEILTLLNENKELYEDLKEDRVLQSFTKMQNELIEMFNKFYCF